MKCLEQEEGRDCRAFKWDSRGCPWWIWRCSEEERDLNPKLGIAALDFPGEERY